MPAVAPWIYPVCGVPSGTARQHTDAAFSLRSLALPDLVQFCAVVNNTIVPRLNVADMAMKGFDCMHNRF